MTAKELAKLVISTLDAQRDYFRTEKGAPGWYDKLDRSKQLEKQLRKEAEQVLNGQPSLFEADLEEAQS